MSSGQNEQSLRIFTIISQIEQLLESAPKPKLGAGGPTRRLIDTSEMFDLLGDLKVTIPEDIRRANSILIEADSLLEHANQDALDIIDQSQKEANDLHKRALHELEQTRAAAEEEFEARVAESNVLLEVQRRCELLQQHAEQSATVVYDGAKQYADAILQQLQNYLVEYYNRVEQNREELGMSTGMPTMPQYAPPTPIQPRQPRAASPVEPIDPPTVIRAFEEDPDGDAGAFEAQAQQEEQQEETWAPKRKRGGFFRRKSDDLFPDEDDEDEDDEDEDDDISAPLNEDVSVPPFSRHRKARHVAAKELDMDLEE